jgi:septum formation protein
MTDIYLASRSSRRRDLLRQIGVRFEPLLLRLSAPRGPDVEETPQAGESAAAFVERIAVSKAERGHQAVALRHMLMHPVLAADTVVVVDGEILAKPADLAEAQAFLRRLAGRAHEVRTFVALARGPVGRAQIFTAESVSQVHFAPLTEPQIDRYCATGEPLDKAGGYAIQGLAATFVERLQGSYSGVVGLPLFETAQLLRQAGVAELP